MVNVTLARGHHAQTRHTARNFFNFRYDISMPNKTVHYYFLTGEDDIARFDSWQYTPILKLYFCSAGSVTLGNNY
jgi:hypothetical protein